MLVIILFVFLFFTASFTGICSSAASFIPLDGVSGPESIAFDCEGRGPYVGVSDGSVLRWEGEQYGWEQFSIPSRYRLRLCDGSNSPLLEPYCGRPLGLEFDQKTCQLYIADSTYGLLAVGPNGGVATQLAHGINGIPFLFTNGLDIDRNSGIIYFTDSSTRFHRRSNLVLGVSKSQPLLRSSLKFSETREYEAIILTDDQTGRLIQYDPSTRTVTVLLRDLGFPNGVAVSHDGTFVLVTETNTGRVLRYWLKGPKVATYDVFVQLPGQPDNIKRNARGEFWVAVNPFEGGPRIMPPPQLVSITNSQAMKLNENGTITEVFVGNDNTRLEAISEAQEYNGSLWIGSVVSSYVSVFSLKKL